MVCVGLLAARAGARSSSSGEVIPAKDGGWGSVLDVTWLVRGFNGVLIR